MSCLGKLVTALAGTIAVAAFASTREPARSSMTPNRVTCEPQPCKVILEEPAREPIGPQEFLNHLKTGVNKTER